MMEATQRTVFQMSVKRGVAGTALMPLKLTSSPKFDGKPGK